MDTGVWRATVYRVAKSWIHLSSYTVFLFFLSCFLSFYHLHHPLSGLSHQHLLSWGWWWFSRSVVPDSYSPMDCSPPGSSVHGISQVRILEWLAISFSRGSSQPRNQNSCLLRKAFLSLLAILWSSAFKWVYLSFFPLLSLPFFSQLFVRPPQTAILLFCRSTFMEKTGETGSLTSLVSLLQGIFPTQGLNPGLQYCMRILYQLSYQG